MAEWKTIDTLMVSVNEHMKLGEAAAADESIIRRGKIEFKLLMDRPYGTHAGAGRIDPAADPSEKGARFKIMNKALDLSWEDATVEGCIAKMKEYLVNTQDVEGVWKVWVSVKANGGYGEHYHGQHGQAEIQTQYYAVLTMPGGKTKHITLGTSGVDDLPDPWDGTWAPPQSVRAVNRLTHGLPECATNTNYWGKKKDEDEMSAWLEATPELVATLRHMQKQLGEFGKLVEEAMRPKNIAKTIAQVRDGQFGLLGPGGGST